MHKYYKLILLLLVIIYAESYSQVSNFNDALISAKTDKKKIVIDFYTDWCGWCTKMDKDTYGNKEVKSIMNDFIFVKINAEGLSKVKYNGKDYTEADLAALFQVSGYPTTVFLESDGKLIEFSYDNFKMNNLPGYYKAADYLKVLDYIRYEKYKTTDLSKIL